MAWPSDFQVFVSFKSCDALVTNALIYSRLKNVRIKEEEEVIVSKGKAKILEIGTDDGDESENVFMAATTSKYVLNILFSAS